MTCPEEAVMLLAASQISSRCKKLKGVYSIKCPCEAQWRARSFIAASSPAPKFRSRPQATTQWKLHTASPVVPLQKQYMSSGSTPKKLAAEPQPSASILLISPSNQILLLHRVRTSSSFPSAHVFPGGNLSPKQDGDIPPVDDPRRHQDGPVYRLAAIRECFEESGILLARRNDGSGAPLRVGEEEREKARREIHAGRLKFSEWVASCGGIVDTDSLIPFTRWITPTNIPKRFTTQMYLAFVDLLPTRSTERSTAGAASLQLSSESTIPVPTSDGGVEHTEALFAPCSEWLRQARANEIILFPPQFYLMHLLAPFLMSPSSLKPLSTEELQEQRSQILDFLKGDGDGRGVLWADKVMSPIGVFRKKDGRSILALDKPGPELEGSERSGDFDRVVLINFSKEGPRNVEVMFRRDALAEEKVTTDKEIKL